MKIEAVKLYENGFMTQPFACGGEGAEGLDPSSGIVPAFRTSLLIQAAK